MNKSNEMYPTTTREDARERAELAPEIIDTWRNFSKTVFKEGAIPEKTKQLIAIAVAHTTQCPYCIRSHTRQAIRKGATKQEIMEAVWIASEMRAGAAYSHSQIAQDEWQNMEHKKPND